MKYIAALGLALWAVMTPAAAEEETLTRWQDDVRAMEATRPGYAFWQHLFTIPDGSIAYGSATDGRLLAVFPTKGDWKRDAVWSEPWLASLLEGE